MRSFTKIYFSYLLAISLSLIAGCKPQHDVYYNGVVTARRPNVLTAVDYGFKENKLCFVVFRNGQQLSDKVSFRWTTLNSGGNVCVDCYIVLPNSKRLPLESANQAFEISDGVFSEYSIMCSRGDLESYIKNETNLFTVAGLTNYLARIRR